MRAFGVSIIWLIFVHALYDQLIVMMVKGTEIFNTALMVRVSGKALIIACLLLYAYKNPKLLRWTKGI